MLRWPVEHTDAFLISPHLLAAGDFQAQAGLLGFKLTESAPDSAFHKVQVLADLLDTQALDFDHLNDLVFEACVKASSGFLILHVMRHLGLEKTYHRVRLN